MALKDKLGHLDQTQQSENAAVIRPSTEEDGGYDQKMAKLIFQLVFQFDATKEDFSSLMDLMQNIESHLANERDVLVDGNDFGRGEFNIFIHTNEPMKTFHQTAECIGSLRPNTAFSAGYRAFTDDTYTSIFPYGNQAFSVL